MNAAENRNAFLRLYRDLSAEVQSAALELYDLHYARLWNSPVVIRNHSKPSALQASRQGPTQSSP